MRKAASRKRLHAILVVAVLVCIFPRNVPGQCRSLRTFSLPAGVAGVSGGGEFDGDANPPISPSESAFGRPRGDAWRSSPVAAARLFAHLRVKRAGITSGTQSPYSPI